MINAIKRLLGLGPTLDYAQLIKAGAVIVDVRSKEEFAAGHIEDSINIPLELLKYNLNMVKDKSKIVITCCASGMRSANAKRIFIANGYNNVYNGGGWQSLQNKIQ